MKKLDLSYKTHLLRILAILCLLSSYLWIAPSQVHASPVDFREYPVLGNEEQTYVIAPTAAFASAQEQTQPQTFGLSLTEHLWPTDPPQTDDSSLLVPRAEVPQTHSESNPSAPLQQEVTTTLTVNIISSPWATLDSNNPSGVGEEVPQVFVVEAVITNTGLITATGVTVNLDYGDEPPWELLEGEDPDRITDLAPDAAYHAYWFARYSTDIGASHQYTVTAEADNADPVATSDNYYENPDGNTVQTRSTLSTGNSGVIQANADVVVGVAFTVTIEYDLGTNPGHVP